MSGKIIAYFFLSNLLIFKSYPQNANITFIGGLSPENLELGMGFNYDNIPNNAPIFSIPNNMISQKGRLAKVSKMTYTIISDRARFRNSLTANASFSYRTLGKGIESSLGLNYEFVKDQNCQTICFSKYIEDSVRTIKTEAKLKNMFVTGFNPQSSQIKEIWGTHYVSQIIYGRQINVYIKVYDLTKKMSDLVSASVGGTFGTIQFNSEFSKFLSEAIRQNRVDMKIFARGMDYPDSLTAMLFKIEDTTNLQNHFGAFIEKCFQSLTSSSEPMRYVVTSLKTVGINQPSIIDPDEPILNKYLYDYNEFESIYLRIQDFLNYTDNNAISEKDTKHLKALMNICVLEMKKIAEANNKCFKNIDCTPYSSDIYVRDSIFWTTYYKFYPVAEMKMDIANATIDNGTSNYAAIFEWKFKFGNELKKYVTNKNVRVLVSFNISGIDNRCQDLAYSFELRVPKLPAMMIENKTGIGQNQFPFKNQYFISNSANIKDMLEEDVKVGLYNLLSFCVNPAPGMEKYPIRATDVSIKFMLE